MSLSFEGLSLFQPYHPLAITRPINDTGRVSASVCGKPLVIAVVRVKQLMPFYWCRINALLDTNKHLSLCNLEPECNVMSERMKLGETGVPLYQHILFIFFCHQLEVTVLLIYEIYIDKHQIIYLILMKQVSVTTVTP